MILEHVFLSSHPTGLCQALATLYLFAFVEYYILEYKNLAHDSAMGK
jgi:hypothetical protein